MDIVKGLGLFLKKNAGWVLTALSSIGVVGTAMLAANEAPKVQRELAIAQADKIYEYSDHFAHEAGKAGKMTMAEKAKIIIPGYLPSILVGMTTIACMIGAQIFNVKQQAMLLGMYGLLSEQYSAYRKEVQKEVGKEREKEIYISSQKQLKELRAENERLRKENAPQLYEFAMLPGIIFEAKQEHINNVFYHMMWSMLNHGEFSLKELYDHIGLPECVYNTDDAEEYGWEAYENEITWGTPAVDFGVTDIQNQDGKTIHVLCPYYEPYKLGLDYGMSDSSINNLYPDYDYDKACKYAEEATDDEIVRFEQPELYFQHTF